jgi:hypothetical protein
MALAVRVVPSIGSTADVDLRAGAVPHLLAVVQHRGVVLLALTDDDDAVHAYGADEHAHRIDRHSVRAVLVAAADPAAGCHRCRLGDADEVEREVAVRRLGGGVEVAGRPPVGRRVRTGLLLRR